MSRKSVPFSDFSFHLISPAEVSRGDARFLKQHQDGFMCYDHPVMKAFDWIQALVTRTASTLYSLLRTILHILKCSVLKGSLSKGREAKAFSVVRHRPSVMPMTAWSCSVRTSHLRHPPLTQATVLRVLGPTLSAKNRVMDGGLVALMEESSIPWVAQDQENSTLLGKSAMWYLLLCMDILLVMPLYISKICKSLHWYYYLLLEWLLQIIQYCHLK